MGGGKWCVGEGNMRPKTLWRSLLAAVSMSMSMGLGLGPSALAHGEDAKEKPRSGGDASGEPEGGKTPGAKPEAKEAPAVERQAEGEKPSQKSEEPRKEEYRHAAATSSPERVVDRQRMVEKQIAHPWDGRTPVKSEAVLEAMRAVPRHAFVPEGLRDDAYEDTPLPIGQGQTISQPYIVAWMTEALELGSDSRVLEVGTGSGYQAAVLAHLTPYVYSVELNEELAAAAKKTLQAEGYKEVECRQGDGYKGWAEKGPFDAIIVTCAAGHLPPPLWEQLKPGGRIVIPIGGAGEVQKLVLITKTKDGKRESKTLSWVRFVPLRREK